MDKEGIAFMATLEQSGVLGRDHSEIDSLRPAWDAAKAGIDPEQERALFFRPRKVAPLARRSAWHAFWAAVVLAGTTVGSTCAMAQPFDPVRELTTWYTDRSLIDIEVVGSTSMLPDIHRLEPERVR